MKRILFTVMGVVLCLGLMGGAFAYFSDTEESTGNTFTAGTMELYIESGPGSSPVTFDDMKPGDTESGTIVVKNIGSLAGNLYGRTTYVKVPSDGDDLGEVLNVTSWTEPGWSGNPGMTLKALVDQTHPVDLSAYGYDAGWMAYGSLAKDATGTFSMELEFEPTAGNEYQSEGINVTFEFVLIQEIP